MTDTEIKKALECCATDTCFTNSCPFEDESDGFDISKCTSSLSRISLDLINRQQAKIERLTALSNELEYDLDLMRQEKAVVQAEAIKEFAERMKIYVVPQKADGYNREIILKSNIDNLVTEMVGETNG